MQNISSAENEGLVTFNLDPLKTARGPNLHDKTHPDKKVA